jgi:ABC-2 type transport system ATP-binding protein
MPADSAASALETTALTKRFGRSRAVEDLTLTVPRGEVFGFLGPNGAGKTTTIRLLLGLLRPSSGSARILGHDAWRMGPAARRRVGYLPGDFAFDPHVTGSELLDLMAALRGGGDRAYVRELARRFEAELDRPIGDLSRGTRQKIGLLQAVAHRPRLLIMDEPTSGLDPLVQDEFALLVAELRGDGTTVFLSSHNLAEVEKLCSRVGILRAGRLVTVERVAELTGRAIRHVHVRFGEPVETTALTALPGVQALAGHHAQFTFTVSGALDPLLELLAAHPVAELEVTRPSLDEAFAAYYGQPEPVPARAPRGSRSRCTPPDGAGWRR